MNIEHRDLAGLLSQLPGGELLDTVRSKRALVVVGATIVAISAIIIAFQPSFPLVFTGLVLDHEIAPAAKSSFAATHALRAATRSPCRRVTHLDSEPKFRAYLAAFREGLQKLGWTEGRNIGIEGAPT